MWERLESLANEIKEAWYSTPDREGLGGVMATLNRVQRSLHSWSKKHFGSVSTELEQLRTQLEEVKLDPNHSRADVRVITDQMDELLY